MAMALLFLVITAAIAGPSIVVAVIGSATIKALARNPSCSPVLLMGMIVILIFNQAIVVTSLFMIELAPAPVRSRVPEM